jgi:hypothetical protein
MSDLLVDLDLDLAMLGIPTFEELARMQDIPIAPLQTLAVEAHAANVKPNAPPAQRGRKRAKQPSPTSITKAKKAVPTTSSEHEVVCAAEPCQVTKVVAEPAVCKHYCLANLSACWHWRLHAGEWNSDGEVVG